MLKLFFLGSPSLEQDGQSIDLGRRKAVALLAYLAVTGQSHSRDALAALFWPEADQSRSRAALRRVLSDINRQLGSARLESEGETVALQCGSDIWVDVGAFQALLAGDQARQREQNNEDCLAPLTEAVALYRDDFLAGFTLPDCPDFDRWQFFQSESLRQGLANALAHLVDHHSAAEEFETAISYARRWSALDALLEPPHRALMALYARTGQRNAALRQYQECVRILDEELGVQPTEETTALYERIRRGELGSRPRPEPVKGGAGEQGSRGAGEQDFQPPIFPSSHPPNLPTFHSSNLPLFHPSIPVQDELRLVTVLFVGLAGVTDPTWELQAEDVVEAIQRLQQIVIEIGPTYETRMERVGGEGFQLLFGVPQIHEDDARRAIQAGLEIRRAAEASGLKICIGISTGQIYFSPTGTAGAQTIMAIGPVVNLAARLQHVAKIGQVLVSQATYRHTRRIFVFQPVSVYLNSRAEPVTAYELLHPLARLEKERNIEGLQTELVGRDEERDRLKGVLARLLQGQGQIITLTGEAGVGKSRLIAELKQMTRQDLRSNDDAPRGPSEKILWLEGRCLEFRKATSYWPFIDLLQAYLVICSEDEQDQAKCLDSILQEMIRRGDITPAHAQEMAAFLANLLSFLLNRAGAEIIKHADPEQVRHQTFRAIYDFFIALARQQPLILVFDDLHWADDLSLDLMTLLLEAISSNPLLLVYIYRPERQHKSQRLARLAEQRYAEYYTSLQLQELAAPLSRRLVDSLLGADGPLAEVKALVLEKSRGNPFFIEEAIRSLIDAGLIYEVETGWHSQADLKSISVPETVQSVILNRIDHLEPHLKQLLQHMAVMGRLFRPQVIAQTLGPEIDLEQALYALEELALIYQERVIPEAEYAFRHVLVQETIYQTLSRRRRSELHRQMGEAIEWLYPDDLKAYYEQLAYHYYNSDVAGKAVEYLIRAGQKSCAAYFNDEAIHYLQKGLQRLEDWPDSPADLRAAWRLAALTSLGQLHHGIGKDREAEQYLRQAIAAGQEAGISSQEMIRLYYWLTEVLHWLGRYSEPISLAEAGLALLTGDEMESVEAVLMNQAIAVASLNLGNYELYQKLTYQTARFIKRLPYSEELRAPYIHIIMILTQKKKNDQALEWIEYLERLAGEHYDLRAMAEAHEQRWSLSFEQGLLYDPQLHFSHILELYTKIGDNSRLWRMLGSMVWNFLVRGDLAEARRHADWELETARQLALDDFLAESLLNRGIVLLAQGAWPEAAEAFEQAARLASAHQWAWVEWAALYCLGRLFLLRGNRQAAFDQFQTALIRFDLHMPPECRFQWWLLSICLLSSLEAASETPETFQRFYHGLPAAKQQEIASLILERWPLEPVTLAGLPSPQFHEPFTEMLAPGWQWYDHFSDCSFNLGQGLEIRAANGRDLWYTNRSAPRLLRPVSGDFILQTICTPPLNEQGQSGPKPVLGGLLLWQDSDTYVRLVWGSRGPAQLSFEGCIGGKDIIIGQGRLFELAAQAMTSDSRVFLRLERRAGRVQAFCSANSEQWYSLGQTAFPAGDAVEAGLHAIGWIDRTIYPGAYPGGTAIRFESFEMWG